VLLLPLLLRLPLAWYDLDHELLAALTCLLCWHPVLPLLLLL
jgi:hypothetical protein